MDNNKPKTIEEYVAACPAAAQPQLREIWAIIREAEPQAGEKISWGMPTFVLGGHNLVHFALGKHHIGFYPGASGVQQFLPRLAAYKTSKGAVQFPQGEPLPRGLILEMVAWRAQENLSWGK